MEESERMGDTHKNTGASYMHKAQINLFSINLMELPEGWRKGMPKNWKKQTWHGYHPGNSVKRLETTANVYVVFCVKKRLKFDLYQ